MSIEDNEALIRRFLLETWGQKRLSTVSEVAAPNISVYYPVMQEPVRGHEAYKQLLTGHHTAFADVQLTVDEVIAAGDRVVARWTQRVIHQGKLLNIPPTGKQITFTGITIYRVENGKVVEERGEENLLGVMWQLGVIPPPR